MAAASRKANGCAKSAAHWKTEVIVHLDARAFLPWPENTLLYKERTRKDSDYAQLVESVRRDGVQAPLLVSQDNYIISGHQRRKAAIETERFLVPVIFLNPRRNEHTPDQWIALLREHNSGRNKTFDELIREKLVDINPDEAIAQIVDDRAERTRARVATIDVGDRTMKRYGISDEKRGMVEAILEVRNDLDEYLPVSLRAIHYRLLVKSFFRNSKQRLRYLNEPNSYKDLSDVATRLRVAEQIP
jgi:hypothetical protein